MHTYGPMIAKNARSGRLLGGAPVQVTTLDGTPLATEPAGLVTNHEGYLPAFTVDTDQVTVMARPRGGDPLPLHAHEGIQGAAEAADTINTGRLSEDALKSTIDATMVGLLDATFGEGAVIIGQALNRFPHPQPTAAILDSLTVDRATASHETEGDGLLRITSTVTQANGRQALARPASVPAQAGQTVTVTVDYRSIDPAVTTGRAQIVERNAAGSVSGGTLTPVLAVTGEWQTATFAHTYTAEAATADLQLSFDTDVVAGQTIDYRHFGILTGDAPLDYFDGSSTSDEFVKYAWTGAPGASASTRTTYEPGEPLSGQTITARLNTLDNEVEDLRDQIAPGPGPSPAPTGPTLPVPTPTGFTWTDHPLDLRTDGRSFITTFDVALYAPTGKTYYVAPNGSNSNDGLAPATALRSIHVARLKPDCDVIIVAAGDYGRAHMIGVGSTPTARDVTIKAADGAHVTVGTWDTLTWTPTSGQPNVYQATRSLAHTITDASIVDALGDYYVLPQVPSVAEAAATPGTWHTDGTTVYVHTPDSRAPDAAIRTHVKVPNTLVGPGHTLYAENIHFEGGLSGGVNGTVDSRIFLKGGSIKYVDPAASGGLQIRGSELVVSQGVEMARCPSDGFNYHADGGIAPRFLEIDCIGRDNGTTTSDQCSTSHGGAVGIRLGGHYRNATGQVVADVNPGTQTWNLECTAYGAAFGAAWFVADGATTWLDHCDGYAAPYGLQVATGGTAHQRRAAFDGVTGEATYY